MKRKLLFIGSLPPPYHGVTIQNDRLINSKLVDEFTIIHIDTTDRRDLTNLGKFDFMNVYLALKNLLQLVFQLLTNRISVTYLTISQNNLAFLRDGIFIIASKIFSKSNVVVHFHGGNYLNFYVKNNYIMKFIISFIYKLADYGIILGDCFKPMVSKWFADSRLFVIPNGIDFPNTSERMNYDVNNNIQLSYIGLLTPEKGLWELISAFYQLNKQYPDLHLNIAGEFAYQNEQFNDQVQTFIRDKNLDKHITFWGIISGSVKIEFFQSTDIFVFPSWVEGHPVAIIEAMATGCAIIATKVGAIPEMITDNQNGLLISSKSTDDIISAIELLVQNPDKRKSLGESAYHSYLEKFTSDINIKLMSNMFHSIS